MIGFEIKKSHFNYGENLAKAGVFEWVTNIHEHKGYYAFDNSLLFTESVETLAQIFPR